MTRLDRRSFVGLLALLTTVPASAATSPSLNYMQQAAKDLLHANRQGTVASFRRAIVRHADLENIATYSLGQYKTKLKETQRDRYYDGVATFMARYFADQSREYRVAKYELGEPRAEGEKDVKIASKVFLLTGKVYTVTWYLTWREGRYRVSDVKVLGFSLVYLQRNLFTSFIAKKNGDVSQLVAALNR
jgi:phospholipid transport system substrate-binding protein